jgi:hypothetical protein
LNGAVSGEHVKESFVARLWFEPGTNGDAVLRGHIRHVQSEAEEYFQGLEGMRAFLGRVSGTHWPVAESMAPDTETKGKTKHHKKVGK